jgi:hypothetical protein
MNYDVVVKLIGKASNESLALLSMDMNRESWEKKHNHRKNHCQSLLELRSYSNLSNSRCAKRGPSHAGPTVLAG